MAAAAKNKHGSRCDRCLGWVQPGKGFLVSKPGVDRRVVRCARCTTKADLAYGAHVRGKAKAARAAGDRPPLPPRRGIRGSY